MFDNFDFKQQVHSMTEQHQNIDVHWVTHLSVENRVSENHLSSAKPAADAVMQMENGVCLPTRHEHHLQRENYIAIVWHVSSLWSVSTYHTSTARKWLRNQKWYYMKMTYRPTFEQLVTSFFAPNPSLLPPKTT